MPTIKELQYLYNNCEKAINPNDSYAKFNIWTSETEKQTSAWAFNFLGNNYGLYSCNVSLGLRVFAVRNIIVLSEKEE